MTDYNITPELDINNTYHPSTDCKICDDIFEAIRQLHPVHHMLYLKNCQKIDYRIPSPSAEILRYDNGKRVGLPYSFEAGYYKNIMGESSSNVEFLRQHIRTHFPGLYRGEYKFRETTLPSCQRDISRTTGIPFSTQQLIDLLKIEEFTQIAKTFPNTILAQMGKININWEALAQHYGLRTNLIDVSSEPFIAAFFATHRYDYDTDQCKMVTKGIGCIKKAHPISFYLYPVDNGGGDSRINSIIGVQHFKRPTLQRAFCWNEFFNYQNNTQMNIDESKQNTIAATFQEMITSQPRSWKLNWRCIKFQQSAKMTRKIHDLFYNGDDCSLFPDELISKAAKDVERSKSVTINSIYSVAKQINKSPDEIINEVKSAGYSIVFYPAFTLSDKDIHNLCYDIQKYGLYPNTDLFERKIYFGDEDGKLFEPDDSYSTFNAGTKDTMLALIRLGNEVFRIA
ncbi:MAG: FRG domain-containing protein [Methanocorpusculum sp.]|uniref:FRG domain-containing protein n=1 Tax=Methanocorpusculum sp. TaxID=2058474 RepID=UPI002725C633|nr:FRG domain-containing protein [Methanocorpusculum sp.]MDO9522966.1 FRG domain-containing protein [Methanocorpusculum sp.]